MERSQSGHIPQKSSSFSSTTFREEKLRETDRNFSLGSIRFEDRNNSISTIDKPDRIDEEEEEEEEGGGGGESGGGEGDQDKKAEGNENVESTHEDKEAAIADVEETPHADDLNTISIDIERFLCILISHGERAKEKVEKEEEEEEEEGEEKKEIPDDPLPEIPESKIDKFAELVEQEIIKYESGTEKLLPEHHDDEPSLLDAVNLMSKITSALAPFSSSDPKYMDAMNRTGSVLHHAMSFLEDEFYALLEESSAKKQDHGSTGGRTRRPPSFSRSMQHDQGDRCVLSPSAEPTPVDSYPPPEIIARFRAIANAMISAGYDTECRQVFAVVRSNAFSAAMSELGFEKIAIDDVQRMPWDALEAETMKWIKAFRHAMTTSLPLEKDLCDTVFSTHRQISSSIFEHLTESAILSFLNFAEALAMTKRSAEKLFKMLDIYEALRDMIPKIETLFPCGECNEEYESSSPIVTNLKSEMSSVQSRLGEAAVAIFCDLESSIKSDAGKNTVPGGAVHPLTRYVMNYLKFSCEYIGTLEQIFKDHNKSDDDNSSPSCDNDENSKSDADNQASSSANYGFNQDNSNVNNQTPFAVQLSHVMELLQANLDSKAKLYKDLALSNIFLMNNGRYIVQKIKGSGEIKQVLGDNWYRRRSSELRQYHNNYKRETWSKVLTCFKDDGLTVKGSVYKPVLKERFKSFNAMFEEIHKTQSMWIVSDEQLQSELRVSVSAVVVPAYRSFLGRFSQYLDPGRQTEKYIKFGPEDLETYIDELFDGNPSSMMMKRR